MPLMTSLEQSFSNLTPLTFRGGDVFVFGDCLVHFRMLGSIPVLSPLDPAALPLSVVTAQTVSTHCHMFHGSQNFSPVKNTASEIVLWRRIYHINDMHNIIYWPYWLFVAACRFSLVVVTGGYPLVVLHGFSCPTACGIFLDQGLSLCPLHWMVDTYPLDHQGSPVCTI